MTHQVVFRPAAEADLIALYDYIAGQGSPQTARRFIENIETACMSLAHFPERGAKRDDIITGLRILVIGGRVTVAYRVLKTRVEIVTIAYGGRDYASALRKGG